MEAPVPDEKKSAWKYLDIYLFSNGQVNSPPRKYHLISDHLDLWPETLKELSHEQFGSSDYIINLYDTQGHLINTPLELKNNKAYVAVRSPDKFIDAGYDRYLLKATRSWEKRQDKRSSNTAEKPDEDLMTGKFDPESFAALKTIVPSTVDNLGSEIVKPRDKSTSIFIPLDRAERNSIKRSSLSKKNDTSLSPAKLIKSPIQRRETNIHNDETPDETTRNKSPFKGRVHKVFQKRRNSEAVLSKVEEVVSQLEHSSPKNDEQINAKTKRSETRSRMTKPVENENDQQKKPKTIPHFIGNRPRILTTKPVENEKDQQRTKLKPFSNSFENRNRNTINSGATLKIEQNKPKLMPHLNENQLDTELVDQNFAEQHFKANNQTLGEIVNKNENVINVGTPLNISDNNKNIINKNDDDPLKKEETLSQPATYTMTNILPNLSKGIINMRIEVWSSSDVKRNASCEIKAPVIILSNEIGSQVDMAGQTGQNKVLHQVIASDKDGIDGNLKVILVRSCYPNSNKCESSKDSGIGECVMFLPVIKLDELYCRCSGGETNNNVLGTNSSTYNPLKKQASCMSIHKENANTICVTDSHHEEILLDSAKHNLNDGTIKDKIEPLDQKLGTSDKKFEETTKTLDNSPSKLVNPVKSSEVDENSKIANSLGNTEVPTEYILDSKEGKRETEYSVSKPDYTQPVDSEEPKSEQTKLQATQPETKETVTSNTSKLSKSPVPAALDLEKVKESKTYESIEIIPTKTEELNIKEPEQLSAFAKCDEIGLSATSVVIRDTEERTLQYNNEKLTKASAVAGASSLLETGLEPVQPKAPTQNKASQTEWTDMLWEAKLEEDGHYSFHLPPLSRIKEYNL